MFFTNNPIKTHTTFQTVVIDGFTFSEDGITNPKGETQNFSPWWVDRLVLKTHGSNNSSYTTSDGGKFEFGFKVPVETMHRFLVHCGFRVLSKEVCAEFVSAEFFSYFHRKPTKLTIMKDLNSIVIGKEVFIYPLEQYKRKGVVTRYGFDNYFLTKTYEDLNKQGYELAKKYWNDPRNNVDGDDSIATRDSE